MPNNPKNLTGKELQEVESMAGLGLRFDDIARIKNMSDDTLKKYAKEQLQRGRAMAKAQVMQTAFKMATSGKVPAMTMFWLKTQAGWRENMPVLEEIADQSTSLLTAMTFKQNNAGVQSSQAIIAHLAATLDLVKQGELDPKVASSIATVTNTLMKAISQGEMEARLTSLEAMTNTASDSLELDL
jgi:hypothetical protein